MTSIRSVVAIQMSGAKALKACKRDNTTLQAFLLGAEAMLMGRMTLRMSPGARVEAGSIPVTCRHSPRGITRGARAYRMTDAQPFGIPRSRKAGVLETPRPTRICEPKHSNLSDGITVPVAPYVPSALQCFP